MSANFKGGGLMAAHRVDRSGDGVALFRCRVVNVQASFYCLVRARLQAISSVIPNHGFDATLDFCYGARAVDEKGLPSLCIMAVTRWNLEQWIFDSLEVLSLLALVSARTGSWLVAAGTPRISASGSADRSEGLIPGPRQRVDASDASIKCGPYRGMSESLAYPKATMFVYSWEKTPKVSVSQLGIL
ncbi:hypothetical protein CC2G_007126 [Coprinopsis cinerea AmutBmut pab1-1]|nr:hypothetical protein CC2G_007126 [Coprinopsis cinerea AmutBmut pab1-1]